MPRIVRKQRPPDLTDYRKFKSYLRLDFEKRCAYCHMPELRYGTPGNYHVDHFRPKSMPEFRRLICHYPNLFYACRDCNVAKGSAWPDPILSSLGFRFLDPCRVDLAKHWTVSADGMLHPKNRAAEYTIARLHLNRPNLCEWRRDKAALAARVDALAGMIASAKHPDRDLADILHPLLQNLKLELDTEYGSYWR